jgi:phosphatidylglycerophosphate synthase
MKPRRASGARNAFLRRKGSPAGAGRGKKFAVCGGEPKISQRITKRRNQMTPNQVTLTRVAAAFAAVALFTHLGNHVAADLAAVALTIAAIALDGVDGYLARTRGLATPLGAQLDILGDRVVENLFFTFFAVSGLISLWVPVLFFVRGTLTDFLRTLAARDGRSGFGRNPCSNRGGDARSSPRAPAAPPTQGSNVSASAISACYFRPLT